MKDLVIRGGENIFPGETEPPCYLFRSLAECAVFGVRDERLGEELAMFIYSGPGGGAINLGRG